MYFQNKTLAPCINFLLCRVFYNLTIKIFNNIWSQKPTFDNQQLKMTGSLCHRGDEGRGETEEALSAGAYTTTLLGMLTYTKPVAVSKQGF